MKRQIILKYPFEVEDEFELNLPVAARFLTVQVQDNIPCMWFQVTHETAYLEMRKFYVVGTGHPFNPSDSVYLGTFQMLEGMFVGHLYEEVK
jgi:hypothetical protein